MKELTRDRWESLLIPLGMIGIATLAFYLAGFLPRRTDKHQGTSESTSRDLSGNYYRHTTPQPAILSIS